MHVATTADLANEVVLDASAVEASALGSEPERDGALAEPRLHVGRFQPRNCNCSSGIDFALPLQLLAVSGVRRHSYDLDECRANEKVRAVRQLWNRHLVSVRQILGVQPGVVHRLAKRSAWLAFLIEHDPDERGDSAFGSFRRHDSPLHSKPDGDRGVRLQPEPHRLPVDGPAPTELISGEGWNPPPSASSPHNLGGHAQLPSEDCVGPGAQLNVIPVNGLVRHEHMFYYGLAARRYGDRPTGPLGFEPRPPGLEPGVLPLHYVPSNVEPPAGVEPALRPYKGRVLPLTLRRLDGDGGSRTRSSSVQARCSAARASSP